MTVSLAVVVIPGPKTRQDSAIVQMNRHRCWTAGWVLVLCLLPALTTAVAQDLWDWMESPLYEAISPDADLEDVLRVGKVRRKPDWRDGRGATAVMYAAAYGRTDLIAALLERGADVNARDKRGQTAFLYACGSMLGAPFPTPAAMRYLAGVGADVNAVDKKGFSGLHRIVSAMDPVPEAVVAALEVGVDPDLLTRDGFSAASLAREIGRGELAEMILAAGGSEAAPPLGGPDPPTEPDAPVAPARLEAAPLAGLDLPLELEMWLPDLSLDPDETGDDGEPEDAGEIELRVRLAAAGESEEWPDCAATRKAFRDGWAGEVAPAVWAAGNRRYSHVGDGIEVDWHLHVHESWDGEITSKSSRGSADEETVPLCLIGAGAGDWAGVGYEALHFSEEEASDLVLVLFATGQTPESRAQLESELRYPATEPDPRGLLVSINEAGMFPAVLLETSE